MAANGVADKDHEHLHGGMEEGAALRKIQTAGSISISPELFEKIYLSPQNQVKGDIRKTFGNPTPIALGGFLLSLNPLCMALLGWHGAGGLGAAETAAYFFFGGLLMVIGGVLEFILGNTFPSVVFTTFGAFWLTFGGTLQPFYGSAKAYVPGASQAEALVDPAFANTFAFFLVYMGVLCFVFLIASIRTNFIFFLIFLLLVPAFGCLSAAFFHLAAGKADATTLQHAGAGLAWAVCLLGWYLFAVQVFAAVDLPLAGWLPVFDLSTHIKGASDIAREKQQSQDIENQGTGGGKKKFWKRS